MKEILQVVKQLNRAFNHNAEVVFVNTITKEIDDRNAPSLRTNRICPQIIGEWTEGNYGFVHPDYPNLLFFSIDKLDQQDLLACCHELPTFNCSVCGSDQEVTPASLARHEFIHSLQLKLNPNISRPLAENVAEDLEFVDIVKIADAVQIN